ncbi:MAG: aminoglycoside phosphotransferase family protein [Actinomycetota bacterium]|nr:aminoglycoside phosphotransferase family protein [Actinomycetota bacterium]
MAQDRYLDGRAGIDASLVTRLIADQFPHWRELTVSPVRDDGWDNRTYRLGEDMSVRLPTASGYAPAVHKEHRWLPVLAPSLPVPVPVPLAKGAPGAGYPFAWSVRRWLDGEPALTASIADLPALATDVARFLVALQGIDPTGGPQAGEHTFYRGAPLAHYDAETRHALGALAARIDTTSIGQVWEVALSSNWDRAPVWFHGDIASGNLLVREGRLAAVIDFGTSGVGDPACDLVLAWTMLRGESRARFRATMNLDPATWARARGWALWKALICLARDIDTDPDAAAINRRIIDEVVADHDLTG